MSSILFVKVYMWNKKIIFHIQMMLEVAYLKHNYLKKKMKEVNATLTITKKDDYTRNNLP
jgi:hypothetical protein